MDTYVILRRSGFVSPDDLEQAAERSTEAGEQMSEDVRWIRTYALEEDDGAVGTVCVYQATSPEAIRRHSNAANMACDEIIKVADTVVVREDPAPAA